MNLPVHYIYTVVGQNSFREALCFNTLETVQLQEISILSLISSKTIRQICKFIDFSKKIFFSLDFNILLFYKWTWLVVTYWPQFKQSSIYVRKKVVLGLLERRGKEKDGRRKLILKSARSLFLEKGFNNVTVDEIAKFSELGKGSIYLYFNSKEEIYAQVLLNDIEKFNQHTSGLFNKKKSAADLLVEFSYAYADFFLNDSELFRILMIYMLQPGQMNLSEELNPQIIKANNKSIDVFGKILELGLESKELHANINSKQNQYAIWGLLNGIISLYLFSGLKVKRKEKIRTTIKSALEVFIKGLKQAWWIFF